MGLHAHRRNNHSCPCLQALASSSYPHGSESEPRENSERERLTSLLQDIQQEIEAVQDALEPPEKQAAADYDDSRHRLLTQCLSDNGDTEDTLKGKYEGTGKSKEEGRHKARAKIHTSGPQADLDPSHQLTSDAVLGSSGFDSGQLHMKLLQDRLASLQKRQKLLQVKREMVQKKAVWTRRQCGLDITIYVISIF